MKASGQPTKRKVEVFTPAEVGALTRWTRSPEPQSIQVEGSTESLDIAGESEGSYEVAREATAQGQGKGEEVRKEDESKPGFEDSPGVGKCQGAHSSRLREEVEHVLRLRSFPRAAVRTEGELDIALSDYTRTSYS